METIRLRAICIHFILKNMCKELDEQVSLLEENIQLEIAEKAKMWGYE